MIRNAVSSRTGHKRQSGASIYKKLSVHTLIAVVWESEAWHSSRYEVHDATESAMSNSSHKVVTLKKVRLGQPWVREERIIRDPKLLFIFIGKYPDDAAGATLGQAEHTFVDCFN